MLSSREKEVHGLDISMKDLPCVKVLDSQTSLYEELPDHLLFQGFAVLLLHVFREVSSLTIFHYDENSPSFLETCLELHNVWICQGFMNESFLLCLLTF